MELRNIWGKNNNEGFFRKQVQIEGKIESAYARIYVDTGYELYINGRFVASVDEWCNTRDYNVLIFLKPGKNQIAVHGINHAGHRGFAFEMVVNGQSVIVSDKTWKCGGEEWDWTDAEFDDSTWDNALELDLSAAGEPQWWTKPGDNKERIIPVLDCSQFFLGNIPKGCNSPYWNKANVDFDPGKDVVNLIGEEYVYFSKEEHLPKVCCDNKIINCTGEISDKKILIDKTKRYTGQSFVVDFNHEMMGYFRMRVQSKSSCSFRLFYGETIDEAMGEISRDVAQHRMLCEEYRLFSGIHEFQSKQKIAFRYVRVEFFDSENEIEADGFSVKSALYPIARRGYFKCSDDELNRVWEMGERTLHYCMQEYYVDAPKRDRFLWTGDARLEALINYYTFFDHELFEFSWEELCGVQMPNGGIPSCFGEGCSMLWDYVAWFVIAFYDYYMYSGNAKFFIQHKENIYKAVDYLSSLCDESGIINVPKNPLGKLWMVELNEYVGADPYLNGLYLRCLNVARMVSKISHSDQMQIKYDVLINKSEMNIKKLCQNVSIHNEFDNIHHTQIQYELAEQDLIDGKISDMVNRIKKCWCTMIKSGSDCMHECTMLPVNSEKIDTHYTDNPPFLSFCHAWTAAATALLPMGIAGVKPTAPGYSSVEIKPDFHSLSSFKCVVPTPHGEIAVKLENNFFSWFVPEKINLTLIIKGKSLPRKNSGSIKVNG